MATPDFSLAVEPRQVDLIPGARGKTTVTVTRTAGFTGRLVITLVSPTQRLSADPLTLEADQTSAELAVNTDRSLSYIPVITRFVATDESGRTAEHRLHVQPAQLLAGGPGQAKPSGQVEQQRLRGRPRGERQGRLLRHRRAVTGLERHAVERGLALDELQPRVAAGRSV